MFGQYKPPVSGCICSDLQNRLILDLINEPDAYGASWTESGELSDDVGTYYLDAMDALHEACPKCLFQLQGSGWYFYHRSMPCENTERQPYLHYHNKHGGPQLCSLHAEHMQGNMLHRHTPTMEMASAQTPHSLVETPTQLSSSSACWARSTLTRPFWPPMYAFAPHLSACCCFCLGINAKYSIPHHVFGMMTAMCYCFASTAYHQWPEFKCSWF